ncbi:hypothetical protein [uncultured Algibacter sp.]|uniref:hypothetical protein n=1 Tax=uncultured Algibacter sp. TaxID=298659 RepID=UPI003217CCAE
MKRTFLLLTIFLISANFLFAQTNFDNGFKKGYKKGYCQDQGINCIEPTSPIPPSPKIEESSKSYNDGYNRGFILGFKERKSSEESNSKYKTAKPIFIDSIIYKTPLKLRKKKLNEMDEKHRLNLIQAGKIKHIIEKLREQIKDTSIIGKLNKKYKYVENLEQPRWVLIAPSELEKVEKSIKEIISEYNQKNK